MQKQKKLTSFEKSVPGRRGFALDKEQFDWSDVDGLPSELMRDEKPRLPELSEGDLMRHYNSLSNMNFGVDTGFYPLGSCTMKYNPKINERAARHPRFANLHPLSPEKYSQGAIQIIFELEKDLAEIAGMADATTQPLAGAHGELTGLLVMRAYHRSRNDAERKTILIPSDAHGTNPASAVISGFAVKEVQANEKGILDIEDLKAKLGPDTAGLMLTNPNTLGLFHGNIKEVADLVHEAGGLLYYDGANLNALMGHAKPGDMGFDVVHYNVHKTLSVPHGGGGPGAGPIGVRADLVRFLPGPRAVKDGDTYTWKETPESIGRVTAFQGNYLALVRTWVYIRTLGAKGLHDVSSDAVLNANYMLAKLKSTIPAAFDQLCMHEFVLSPVELYEETHVSTLNIAKRLIDYGYHPPTIYFPLIVKEAMMIEPTETESKETLDEFIEAIEKIVEEARTNPELVQGAPHTTPVKKLDDTLAARKPDLNYFTQK